MPTDPRTDLLPVVQSDRDRAAERHSAYMRGSLAWMHEKTQCARMLKGAWDEHPTVQCFAAHRLAHAPETQTTAADAIALDGYRAAACFIGADSWDGCSDCMDILKAAKATDILYHPTPDDTAHALKQLRSRYYGEQSERWQDAIDAPETQIGRDGLATQADIVLVSDEFGEGGYQLHGLFYTFEDAMAHVRKDAALPDEALWDTELADKCEIVDGDVRWTAVRQPMRFGLDHPNVLDEVERVANVKRELAERARNMMGLLADLRASVDLDDDSSEGVLGYCDDLETAVHNIAAVASHLPGAAIPADPLRARLVEALKDTTAHLVAAHSLLSRSSKKAAASDKMFDQMLLDYAASAERARAILAGLTPESE